VDFDTQTFTGSPSRVQTSAKSQITASWSPAFLKSLVLTVGGAGECITTTFNPATGEWDCIYFMAP
jgi:hypothetical protein